MYGVAVNPFTGEEKYTSQLLLTPNTTKRSGIPTIAVFGHPMKTTSNKKNAVAHSMGAKNKTVFRRAFSHVLSIFVVHSKKSSWLLCSAALLFI